MSGNFFYKNIGKKISQIREKKNLSQERLSFKSGVDRTYICRIEKGFANPSIRIIERIASALNVSIYLLTKN